MKKRKALFFLAVLASLCAALAAPALAYENFFFSIDVDDEFEQAGDYLWLSKDGHASLTVAVNENTDDLNVNLISSFDLGNCALGFLSGINGQFSTLFDEGAQVQIESLTSRVEDFEGGRAVAVDCHDLCRAGGRTYDAYIYSRTISSQNYIYTVTLASLDSALFQKGVSMVESFKFSDEPSLFMPSIAAVNYIFLFSVLGAVSFLNKLLIVAAIAAEKKRRAQIRTAAVAAVFFR